MKLRIQTRLGRTSAPHGLRALVTLLALGALFAALAFPASGWAVEEDITPPQIDELSVNPSAVDVTSTSKTVTVTAKITDPAGPGGVSSGVEGGTLEYSEPGGGNYCGSGRVCASFVHQTGEEYTATITIAQFAEEGAWTPSARVVDHVGNYREYTSEELEAAGFHADIQVTSTPDTTPPEIDSVTVGPPTAVTVSPPNGPQLVPVEVTATDNLSGVSFVTIEYQGPGHKHDAYAFLERTTGNVFAGHLEFKPYQEAGSWSAMHVEAVDEVGNRRSIEGSELEALKIPNIQVTSSPVDLEAPKIVNFTASAETPCPEGQKGACVDAEAADRTVTLKATVTDNLSGVSSVDAAYAAPGGGAVQPLFVILQKKSGDEFEGTLTIHRFSKAGFWKPQYIVASDNAGNDAFLFETEVPEEAQIAVSRTTTETAEPGGPPVSTGESANEVNPLQSQLSVPPGGTGGPVELKITPRTTQPPPGFYLLEQQLDITAPTQPDTSHPLKIEFLVDSSVFTSNPQVQFPPGCIPTLPGEPPPSCPLTVYKNGVEVPKCTALPPAAISPNPCIVDPQETVGDDIKLTIYSTTASTWNIGVPVSASVPEATPTEVTTSLSGGGESGATITVKEGTAVTDSAALSGEHASEAEGSVTYEIYSDKECTKEAIPAGQVEFSGGIVPASEPETLPPGTYYWEASYDGDALNERSQSTCGSEVEMVESAAPAPKPTKTKISTSLSGGGRSGATITVPEGTAVSDGATLSGKNASKATGTVEYDVYSDRWCTKLVAAAGPVSVTGGVVPPSNPETLGAGTYYWQASYSGDASNRASKSSCYSEVEKVSKPRPKPTTISTSLSGAGESGAAITVPEGTAVTDMATLSGENAALASGTVTYRVYSDKWYSKLVISAGTVNVSLGSIPASNAEKLPAGTYYWQASYSGDSSNARSTSSYGSEVETVTRTTPSPPHHHGRR